MKKFTAPAPGHRYIGLLANVTFDQASRENVSKKNTSSLALEYFKQVNSWFQTDNKCFASQLKREEVAALYEFYKEDFLMFGYSHQEFLTGLFEEEETSILKPLNAYKL